MPRQKLYKDDIAIALSIRLPAKLRDEIENLAAKNRRSLNQEIVWLIEIGLAQEKLVQSPKEK